MNIHGISPFAASSMFAGGSIAHEIAGMDGNPYGDQFLGMDPMELRRGVFAWSGQPTTGGGHIGGGSKELTLTRDSLTQTLFPGYRAPSSGDVLAQVAAHSEIGKLIQAGNVLAWTQTINKDAIPSVFAFCEMPERRDLIFDTLLEVNSLSTWMPRVMWFKSDDTDARDSGAMRRRFLARRARLDDVTTRYQTTVPQFYGRLSLEYRQLSGGAHQMEWNIHGDQTIPDDAQKIGMDTPKDLRALKRMKTCHSSFTLIPNPAAPERTLCAYHINAQPEYMPFVASVITLFMPNKAPDELVPLFQSLLNRTVNRSWTGKRKNDPVGLELAGVPHPTPFRFGLHKVP